MRENINNKTLAALVWDGPATATATARPARPHQSTITVRCLTRNLEVLYNFMYNQFVKLLNLKRNDEIN